MENWKHKPGSDRSTEETAHEHARIWVQLERCGLTMGYYDLEVAATALERADALATFNRKHFEAIPGLTIVEPK
ncbi:MAG TPA: hypothetical protein VI136_26860 [Verrucomicrobiae bacterium]